MEKYNAKGKEAKSKMKMIRAVKIYKIDEHFYFKITTTTDGETNRSLFNLYSKDDRKHDNYRITSLTIDLNKFVGKVVDIVCKKIIYDFYTDITRVRGVAVRVVELYATP